MSSKKVLRGGSWGNYPALTRHAYLLGDVPDDSRSDTGFRVVFNPNAVLAVSKKEDNNVEAG